MIIPFLGGSYEGRSSSVSSETCIGLFYEKGVSGEALVGTPGYRLVSGRADPFRARHTGSAETGPIRGGIDYDGDAYFVRGNKLVVYDPINTGSDTTLNARELGTLKTNSGLVAMAHNGVRPGANQQIMVVDGQFGYIWDNTAQTFTQITDTDFVATDAVSFIDGYFIFPQTNKSDRFWITALYDGTSIDSSDFATAEGSPDEIVNIITTDRQVFIFGAESLEIWYNSGDTDNTFQRYQGGFKQHGCVARKSPARIDNSIMWLTRNDRGHGQIARLGGNYQPEIISTPEINYQISTYKTIDDAWAYTYQSEGHEFYVINFPSANKTWVYDASTKTWHQRERRIFGHSQNDMEGFTTHVFSNGCHYFGDEYGMIWEMDTSIGAFVVRRTINNIKYWAVQGIIPRERTTISVSNEEERTRIISLQLDMDEGVFGKEDFFRPTVGSLAADGSFNTTEALDGVEMSDTDADAVYLQYSKNGGHSWSNELKKDMGIMGEWTKRVIWRRLGWARNWIFRFRFYTIQRPVLKGLIIKSPGNE